MSVGQSRGDVRKFCEWGGMASPCVQVVGDDYAAFCQRKKQRAQAYGFEVGIDAISDRAFDWQRKIVQWAVRRGRAALFLNVGLGKSLMQLEWCRLVREFTGMPGVLHCPIGVREQFIEEAAKFNVDVPLAIVNEPSEIVDGINLINYHKLHKFDMHQFGWVSLDESSILKSQAGRVRTALIEAWSHVRFRLSATATPAPNDHVELGNQAEFLGVTNYADMLNRFFVHDSGETQTWRLRGHAVNDFWRWVSSWAVCIEKPSDVGGSDEGYELPPLNVIRHHVEVELSAAEGFLFPVTGVSATTIHEDRRATNHGRCSKAAELANEIDDYVIIWCDTNYEADELTRLLPDAIEVRGNEPDHVKEEKLSEFSHGRRRVIITKPTIAGFGLNWQHCCNMIFAGVSYSFERYFQSVGRCYRFGQSRQVNVHLLLTDTDSSVESAVARKESDFKLMQSGMATAMQAGTLEEFGSDRHKQAYTFSHEKMELPAWISRTP